VVEDGYQGRLTRCDAENFGEVTDHRSGHITGNTPKGKTDSDEPPGRQLTFVINM
jgi:hypothetical protein